MALSKLETVREHEGFKTLDDMYMAVITDSVCPAICSNFSCDYIEEMEPDQDRGWCPECRSNSMKSVLILGDVI